MPTNRPFFINFLAGFRAHSALSKPSSNSSVSTNPAPVGSTSSQFSSLANTNRSTIAASSPSQAQKNNPATGITQSLGPTATAVQTNLSHTRHPSAATAAAASSSSPSTARSPSSPPSTATNHGFQHRAAPQRRGSDSSSEGGFRDALGGEKWYIGGRTAAGEERFYRLAMVRKERSGDRLSLDRLSL